MSKDLSKLVELITLASTIVQGPPDCNLFKRRSSTSSRENTIIQSYNRTEPDITTTTLSRLLRLGFVVRHLHLWMYNVWVLCGTDHSFQTTINYPNGFSYWCSFARLSTFHSHATVTTTKPNRTRYLCRYKKKLRLPTCATKVRGFGVSDQICKAWFALFGWRNVLTICMVK